MTHLRVDHQHTSIDFGCGRVEKETLAKIALVVFSLFVLALGIEIFTNATGMLSNIYTTELSRILGGSFCVIVAVGLNLAWIIPTLMRKKEKQMTSVAPPAVRETKIKEGRCIHYDTFTFARGPERYKLSVVTSSDGYVNTVREAFATEFKKNSSQCMDDRLKSVIQSLETDHKEAILVLAGPSGGLFVFAFQGGCHHNGGEISFHSYASRHVTMSYIPHDGLGSHINITFNGKILSVETKVDQGTLTKKT
jgi:hypothetical protein